VATKEKIPVYLAPREKRAVNALISRLRKAYGEQIKQAFLFGSKARGDAKSDSDIDLLLLVEKETWAIKDEISDMVADINLEYDLLVDMRVIGAERWIHMAEIQAGLYRTISQDAIPLAS
jgi:predicted nucleotidyltransferase